MRFDAPTSRDYQAANAYLSAKTTVIENGYWPEVLALASVKSSELTEVSFLREAAWVVLSAGLSEIVVRRKFEAVSTAFLRWQSAELIRRYSAKCIEDALPAFGNHRKLRAIARIAEIVADAGFDAFRTGLLDNPIEGLMALPFMGPATSRHLAKNIGLDVAKPDRHLVRLAAAAQYSSADELCQRISWVVGDSVSMIDTVLWRYSTFGSNSLRTFSTSFGDLEH
jgi:hypothetical protein